MARRRGVDQRRFVLLAPCEHRLRAGEVLVEHILPVPLGGVGAGALVEHRLDRAEIGAGRDPLAELGAVEVVGDAGAGEVREFPAVDQVVDDEDVVAAARVQRVDEIRSDESGAAGDDEHRAITSREGRRKASGSGCRNCSTIPNPLIPVQAGIQLFNLRVALVEAGSPRARGRAGVGRFTPGSSRCATPTASPR